MTPSARTDRRKKKVLIRSKTSTLLILRTSPEDSGSYMCVATNIFNKTQVFTSNSSVFITVKGQPFTNALSHFRDFPSHFLHLLSSEVVWNPDISFKVIKEPPLNYSAAVTCRSDKGTPPVTFSLYNRTELVSNITSEDRKATFKVPLILGVHMGWLQCQANNGDQTAYSKRIPIQVGMNCAAQLRNTLLWNAYHDLCLSP